MENWVELDLDSREKKKTTMDVVWRKLGNCAWVYQRDIQEEPGVNKKKKSDGEVCMGGQREGFNIRKN